MNICSASNDILFQDLDYFTALATRNFRPRLMTFYWRPGRHPLCWWLPIWQCPAWQTSIISYIGGAGTDPCNTPSEIPSSPQVCQLCGFPPGRRHGRLRQVSVTILLGRVFNDIGVQSRRADVIGDTWQTRSSVSRHVGRIAADDKRYWQKEQGRGNEYKWNRSEMFVCHPFSWRGE